LSLRRFGALSDVRTDIHGTSTHGFVDVPAERVVDAVVRY
jgi:hypothetical protein